jgi:hypothetical protein
MDFRPWMIESAASFIQAGRVLWESKLSTPSMVNTAIGLEILFKSFNATVDGPSGGIGEQYKLDGKPSHDLLTLFDAIPERVQIRLRIKTYRQYFEGHIRNIFVRARYPYERGGLGGGTNAFVEVGEEILDRVILEYQQGGCTDPWIVAFQMNDNMRG